MLHNPHLDVLIALNQMPFTQRDPLRVLQHGGERWANILGQRMDKFYVRPVGEINTALLTLQLPLFEWLLLPPTWPVASHARILLVLLIVARLRRIIWRRRRGLEFSAWHVLQSKSQRRSDTISCSRKTVAGSVLTNSTAKQLLDQFDELDSEAVTGCKRHQTPISCKLDLWSTCYNRRIANTIY